MLFSVAKIVNQDSKKKLLGSCCLSDCRPACLPACLTACLPACLLAYLPACLPDLPACLPACLLACLPACLAAGSGRRADLEAGSSSLDLVYLMPSALVSTGAEELDSVEQKKVSVALSWFKNLHALPNSIDAGAQSVQGHSRSTELQRMRA
jgi:hypothetical protein